MDRSEGVRPQAIHSVIKEDGVFKVWHSVGKGAGWEWIKEQPYPAYNIWYTESSDGIILKDGQGFVTRKHRIPYWSTTSL